ncbi:7211_t:CDS:2 [Scutellospora calospora]|uniref:7211_t:CDS:1 n=1 Tax=Scutellospora calospora TaxID=85575 RepID=A0ACA9K6P0_9GLOM|nr:7211_t:CDS:2 [Scutellospora calospora]
MNCHTVFLIDVVTSELIKDASFIRSEESQGKPLVLEELASLEKVPDRMPNVYITGLIVLILTVTPPTIEAQASLSELIIAIIIIGFRTGGIKTNTVTIAADQFSHKDPYVKTLKSEKKLLLIQNSPSHQCSIAIFLISILIFVFGKNIYVKVLPHSSALLDLFNVLRIAFKHGRNLDNTKPLNVLSDIAKQYKIKWDDKFVDQIRASIRAYRDILGYPIFWVCFMQIYNNLISQAATMTVNFIPNDMIYPALRRININSRPMTCILIGFVVITSAMLYSAIIQYLIYNTGPCYEKTHCIIDDKLVPNNISVWWQAPAPLRLKSTITDLYLMTLAAGSVLDFVFVPLSKDPYLVWLYRTFAKVALITGIIIFIFLRDFNIEENLFEEII